MNIIWYLKIYIFIDISLLIRFNFYYKFDVLKFSKALFSCLTSNCILKTSYIDQQNHKSNINHPQKITTFSTPWKPTTYKSSLSWLCNYKYIALLHYSLKIYICIPLLLHIIVARHRLPTFLNNRHQLRYALS